jgi:antirestriction protein ArdC
LIAEMGAAFLSTECGISQATIDDSAAYIGSWIKHLRADPKLVVHAAGKAQKAVDWILNTHSSEAGVGF